MGLQLPPRRPRGADRGDAPGHAARRRARGGRFELTRGAPDDVRLLVDDFPACFRFYRDALGLEVTFGEEEGGYASFGRGVSIFVRSEQGEVVELREPGDAAIPIVQVDDVDREAERLRAHVVGGPVSREDWGIRVLYLRDPAGNLLELYTDLPRG